MSKNKNYITVGKLKKLLNQHPDNTPVGIIGHYGEFYELSKDDFSITSTNRSEFEPRLIKVLEISCPDIGPEPD